MLFDLSGKRKRVVQVVYAMLALLMGGSLVLFGIGSDAPGGILDAVGLGGGSNSSTSPQYEQQIEDAEATLETDPKNERALLDLVRYRYLSATESGVTTDPQTGATEVSEEARQELELAAAAWKDYLATDPKRPDTGVAASAAQAYVLLNDADGAARAQRIVAEANPSSAAFGQLAFYLYADGKIADGDEAAERAVAEAPAPERKQVQKNLDALREQAVKLAEQAEKAAKQGGGELPPGGTGIEDPFGSLGGAAPVPSQ